MQHRTKRNHELNALIQSFEERIQTGTLTYLEEQETAQLLEYYEEKGLLEHAVQLVDAAISSNPYRPEYYLLLSRIYYKMDKKNHALDTIQSALTYSPMEYDLLYMKARILTEFYAFDEVQEILSKLRLRSHGKQKTLFLLLEAYNYELQRDYSRMYEVVKEAVLYDTHSAIALKRMWVAVEITKNYKESALVHEEILDNNPYNHLAWFNLGHAYICMGKYEEAISALEFSFIIEPEFQVAYTDCADICMQIGRYRQALEIQLEQLDKFGMNGSLLVDISTNLISLQRHGEAFKYLDKALILDPYNDEAYYNIARAYAIENSHHAVITQMNKAINIEKRREEYYGLIADAYNQVGSFAEADYFYRKATETGPEDPVFWLKHVRFLFDLHEYSAALDVIEESAEYTYSDELKCAQIALLFKSGAYDRGLKSMENLLSDESSTLDTLFSMMPELKNDKTINALLNYFSKG